jgi:hypothetical protein
MLGFGWEVKAEIPDGLQCDWEAILLPHSNDFVRVMSDWMLPSCVKSDLAARAPRISDCCATVRDSITYLNSSGVD